MMTSEESGKIWRLIRNIDVAMLTSETTPHLRARPVFNVQRKFDGTFWFITSEASARVDDLQDNRKVCLTYIRESDGVFVSLSGTADLVYDETLMEKFWSSSAEAWFAGGKDDPDAILLEVHVERAELWDAKTNMMTLLFAPEGTEAYLEADQRAAKFRQH